MEEKNVEGKYLEKEKLFFVEEKKKDKNIWRRENVTMAGQTTNKAIIGVGYTRDQPVPSNVKIFKWQTFLCRPEMSTVVR